MARYKSEHTREAYARAVQQFGASFDVHPAQVKPEHVIAWNVQLRQRYNQSTVNQRLSALSSFYAFVNKHYAHLRKDNPCEAARREAVDPYGKASYLEDGQDIALLNSIDRNTLAGLRDYAVILLALTSGFRLDVFVQARVGDFQNTGGVVRLHYTNKGGEADKARIHANTIRAIVDYMDARGSVKDGDWLFDFGPDDPRTRRRKIQRMIYTRCATVFGRRHGITFHSLRHTAAMNAVKGGASIQEVSGMLRHKSLRVTTIYLQHIDDSAGENASGLLDERYK